MTCKLFALLLFTASASAVFAVPVAADGIREAIAPLTVTATNTLSALPFSYDGRFCKLSVGGYVFTDKDANAPFTVVGTAITWSQANSGYALPVGAVVTSDCTY